MNNNIKKIITAVATLIAVLFSMLIKAGEPAKAAQTTAAAAERARPTTVFSTTAEPTTEAETTVIETTTALSTTMPLSSSSEIVSPGDPDAPRISQYFEPNRVAITQDEFEKICCVVMREAGADYGHVEGCYAVAQCILEGMIRENESATTLLTHYQYKPQDALRRAAQTPPNQKTRDAVYRVFYEGYGVTPSPISVYYNPAICGRLSAFEKGCIYHFEIDGNCFFEQR